MRPDTDRIGWAIVAWVLATLAVAALAWALFG